MVRKAVAVAFASVMFLLFLGISSLPAFATVPGAFTVTNDPPRCYTVSYPSPAVMLRWTASYGVTTYYVYRNGSQYSAPIPASETTYDNQANLTAGQTYTYFVRATNSSGTTDSNTITVYIPSDICSTSLPNLAPFKPTLWTAPIVVSNVTGTITDGNPLYSTDVLYVDAAVINNGAAATAGGFGTMLYVDGQQIHYEMTDVILNPSDIYGVLIDYPIGTLSAGTHTVAVWVDFGGVIDEVSDDDNYYERNFEISSSGAPGGFSLFNDPPRCNAGTPAVRLTWTASSGVSTYDVYRGGLLYAADLSAAATSFDDTGSLTAGQLYGYLVKAKNSSGTTDSNQDTVEIPGDVCGSGPPGDFSLGNDPPWCNAGTPAVRLHWSASSGVNTYDVYRDGLLQSANLSAGTTSFDDTVSLAAGQTYGYVVTAKNSAGTTNSSLDYVVIPTNVCGTGCTLSCTASANPTSGSPPLSVNFSASATPSNCTGTPSFSWDFGDGANSTQQSPTHSYTTAGTYQWSMTASDAAVTCPKSGTITVSSGSCAIACTASAPTAGAVNAPVSFAATASVTPSGCTTPAFDWNFGDGSAHSSQQNPTHTYTSQGSFTWTLTVSGAGASNCTRSEAIAISSGNTITISGHAYLPGQIPIRASGRVTAYDSSGAIVRSVLLNSDGTYGFSLPGGSYTMECTISYWDSTGPQRTAKVTQSLANFSSSQTLDFLFPVPIVMIHGIWSGPGKWDEWISWLKDNQPERIVFTPTYDDTASYEEEAISVQSDLVTDFSSLAVSTPDFAVIAHSKGGLVARVFKNIYGGNPLGVAMKDLIMLGTPNMGSDCYQGAIWGCWNYNLCECLVGGLVNATYPSLPGMKDHVHVIAGTIASACLPIPPYPCGNCTDTQDSDGVVTAYSVFRNVDDQFKPSYSYPGLVIPANHTALGSQDTQFLLSRVIMPYYQGAPFAANCPASTSTDPVLGICGENTPSFTDACVAGHGYTCNPVCNCTANLPLSGSTEVSLLWAAPPQTGSTEAPNGLTATSSTSSSGCSSVAGHRQESVPHPQGPTLLGYNVYRASTSQVPTDGEHRIGFAAASEEAFTDVVPMTSGGSYVVTAIYDQGESAPSNTASPSSVPSPAIASMKKMGSPFRIIVTGGNLQSGIRVYIDGAQWGSVVWKSEGKIKLTGAIKAAVPKGTSRTFRFVNPDGGEATLNWGW